MSAGTVTVDDALYAIRSLDQYLKDACDSCMPKGTYKGSKKPAYWWTQEISDMREVYKRTRRKNKWRRHRPIEQHQKLDLGASLSKHSNTAFGNLESGDIYDYDGCI